MARISRSRARHVQLVPKGRGLWERIFGFTPKPHHRRATFVQA